MKWVYNDGGRAAAGFKGECGDCVTRSIAIITGTPYGEVYESIATWPRGKRSKDKHASPRNGVYTKTKWFNEFMTVMGLVWTPTMAVGRGCTVHLDEAELPAGRLIVAVSRHYTAVIDGVIHDTFDPNDRGATIYPPNHRNVPAAATLLENGNGWIYAPKRCVYGYWTMRAAT